MEDGNSFCHRNLEAAGLSVRTDFEIGFLTEEMRPHKKTGNKVSFEDLLKVIGKLRSIGHLRQSVD
jgi:hypothetical protein